MVLPGISAPLIIGVSPNSMTFVSGSAGFTTNRTMPTGTQAGDFVIHFDYPASGNGAFTPAGWTTIFTGPNVRCIGKVVGASEPAVSGSSSGHKLIAAFRPAKPITRWTFEPWNVQNAGTGDPAAQTVPAPPVGSIVFGYMLDADGGSSSSHLTSSPAFDGYTTHDYGILGRKIYNPGSSPVAHLIDMPDRGAQNILASGAISFEA